MHSLIIASPTCMSCLSLFAVAAACVCVCRDSRLPICVGIRPEWAGWIHAGRQLNRCAISGVGPPSGSIREGFEGACVKLLLNLLQVLCSGPAAAHLLLCMLGPASSLGLEGGGDGSQRERIQTLTQCSNEFCGIRKNLHVVVSLNCRSGVILKKRVPAGAMLIVKN